MTSSIMVTAARYWSERLVPVFPCEPRGKRPLGRLAPHGLHDATTDIERISEWWRRAPDANVGLVTGIAFDVLDVDGLEGLHALEQYRADRPTPWGPVAVTGGGGWHFLFEPTGHGNRAAILPKVDYRGDGGYVVAPPSIHPSGDSYWWCVDAGPDEPIEPAPAWLLELLARPERSGATAVVVAGSMALRDAYGQRAIEAEVGRVVMAPVGGRNDQLNRSAYALGQLVAGGVLGLDDVAQVLHDAGTRAGLDDTEIIATVRSGLASGMRQPRRAQA